MKKSYSINFRYHVLSLKQAAILLALCPFVLLLNTVFPLGVLIGRPNAKTTPLDQYWEQLPTFLIIMVVLCLPVFLLHSIYYIKNRSLSFEVNGDKISINECGNTWSYMIADIVNAEKVLDIFHKNKIDNKGRWFSPWSNYGYIKVEFSDGKIYHFTSLMLEPETFDVFPTKIRYAFVPFLNKKSLAEIMAEKKGVEAEKIVSEEKIEEFKQRFSNYSDDNLEEKIKDSERHCEEAIVAAKRIMEERKRI